MADPTFEARLASQLDAYAQGGVRPIDRYAVAEATISAGADRGLAARLGYPRPMGSRLGLQIAFVMILLVALAVSIALVGSRLLDRRPDAETPDQPAVVVPSPDPSAVAPSPVSADAIVPTGAMAYHRVSHTATVLEDGRVLIVGGFDYGQDGRPSASTAEIYDPTTGSFVPAGPLADVRDIGHSATRLADGRVLLVGGVNQDQDPGERGVLASAEIFDPSTGTAAPTGSLSTPRFDQAAVRLSDGRVAIIGGSSEPPIADALVPSIEIYDPATAMFREGPSGAILRRRSPEAVVLGDGRVFIVGRGNGPYVSDGVPPSSDDANTDVAAIWDPRTGEVHETAAFRDPRSAAAGAFPTEAMTVGGVAILDDGRVLIAALDPARAAWGLIAFDPRTEQFAPLVAIPGRPEVAPAISKLSDGRILLVTGDAASCGKVRAVTFDPSTSVVAPVGLLPHLGTCNGGPGVTVSALAEGSALIAGGHLSGGESVTDASLLRHTLVTAPTARP